MAPETAPAPSVQLEAVSVSFGGLHALKDVSFSVSPGEIVGLIGPNGAGKTTAFNVVCGFVRPNSGRVRFPASASRLRQGKQAKLRRRSAHGRSNLRPSQLSRAGVSRTLQGVGLFPHLTVLENVMAGGQIRPHGGFFTSLFALPSGIRADKSILGDSMGLLERLGVASFALKMPSEIPYGVSKKVAIARALMCAPSLLLLDEPASGLDEVELEDFAALIVTLRREMALLLVEHDMNFVMPLVDRLVVLDFGEVIATGTPAEIQSDPKVIEAYLGVQQ